MLNDLALGCTLYEYISQLPYITHPALISLSVFNGRLYRYICINKSVQGGPHIYTNVYIYKRE